MKFKKYIFEYFKQYEKINVSQYTKFLKENKLIAKFCVRCCSRYKHVYEKPTDVLIKIIKQLSVKYCVYCR